MLFSGVKKEAFALHKKTVEKYNATITDVQNKCELLYDTRQESTIKIEEIEEFIKSIANTPKKFERSLSLIRTAHMKFRETVNYATEANKSTIKSGTGAAVGVGAGATVASLGPTAAMWVATTFGTASTGTAISALSGAAATNAALAWLGGGALAYGGAGMAGGTALLALAGPIGWGIAGSAAAVSLYFLARKNKKIAIEIIDATKKIAYAEVELYVTGAAISSIQKETQLLLDSIVEQLLKAKQLAGNNYPSLSKKEQLLLGTLVNNTLSLAEMLNKTVEQRSNI